jgi:hypothetical protein
VKKESVQYHKFIGLGEGSEGREFGGVSGDRGHRYEDGTHRQEDGGH